MKLFNFTHEQVKAADLELDTGVNPRMPSKEWVRRTLAEGYDPALLGLFIVSERKRDGERVLVLLDGGNRQELMGEAGDSDRAVECRVFYGLTRAEEAGIARRYNNRRQWTSVKLFLNDVTAGREDAVWIMQTLESQGWSVGNSTRNGVMRSVVPLMRVLAWGHKYERLSEAKQALAMAMSAYTAAWPSMPPSYAADIMEGLSYLMLRGMDDALDDTRKSIDLERLTKVLSEYEGGQRAFVVAARGVKNTLKDFNLNDAVAFSAIQAYHRGMHSSGPRRLADWRRWPRVKP
jgi:hypothetical protein